MGSRNKIKKAARFRAAFLNKSLTILIEQPI